MRPDAKVEKVYLYPKPVDFRKSIDGLAALVELDIKVAVFDPVLFVFLNKPRNRVKILYWERNGFCLWLKRLESERFKTSPDVTDEGKRPAQPPCKQPLIATATTHQSCCWAMSGAFPTYRAAMPTGQAH
ncbi:IS66 family insertion sequence element accessory protein TnpB [Pseudomonas baltica]|uniref:IS66 family insertion sequence element accessory protein TnpB n=1 Tax=Pseudomonas baltica TaxID=2762576 RepID=UPI002899E30C|nr:IS66 family insertion sequence element accessory protein TnpB [Pseudomonas baltica]